jgi:hypothetical protein
VVVFCCCISLARHLLRVAEDGKVGSGYWLGLGHICIRLEANLAWGRGEAKAAGNATLGAEVKARGGSLRFASRLTGWDSTALAAGCGCLADSGRMLSSGLLFPVASASTTQGVASKRVICGVIAPRRPCFEVASSLFLASDPFGRNIDAIGESKMF